MHTEFDKRMKLYEQAYSSVLPIRTPVIIRVDGRAFHAFTRGLGPFDSGFMSAMDKVAVRLASEVGNCVFGYVQSDEISLLCVDYKSINTQPWFGNDIQKLVSTTAAIASVKMSSEAKYIFANLDEVKTATFDSRAFCLPIAEVCNYFIWRQSDWNRNSVQMLARSLYSHKELLNKNNSELQEMCFSKGRNWNDLKTHEKRGRGIIKLTNKVMITEGPLKGEMIDRPQWCVDPELPDFTKQRQYIENFL